jgi:hypothetical protein
MGEPPTTASARPQAAPGGAANAPPSAATPTPATPTLATPTRPEPVTTAAIRWVLPIGVVALCVSVVGGYGFHWAWTGVSGQDQLWDLLHVIVLPIVLATLPIWYRTRERWMIEWRIVLGLILGAFAILIVGGYGLGWSWTGFSGNTLWDWLELLALPLVIASLPLWFTTHTRWEGRWRRFGLALLAGFVLTVVGGYGLSWGWTGYQGNTLWDWLRLLLVPFVLPASLAWFAAREEDARSQRRPAEPSAALAGHRAVSGERSLS